VKVAVRCEVCGKGFLVWACHLKRGAGKYCSRLCDAKAKSQRLKGISPKCSNQGKKHSDATKEKIGNANFGKKRSEEAKEKMRQHVKTDEHKRKISESLMGKESKPAIERFMDKVREDVNGCWNWIGSIKVNGYGNFSIRKNKIGKTFHAHRWAYQHFKGEIPPGLTLDHLCRNRKCVNPGHLEAVTQRENVLRGNRPKKPGHLPDPEAIFKE
jgi:hypothetical protein